MASRNALSSSITKKSISQGGMVLTCFSNIASFKCLNRAKGLLSAKPRPLRQGPCIKRKKGETFAFCENQSRSEDPNGNGKRGFALFGSKEARKSARKQPRISQAFVTEECRILHRHPGQHPAPSLDCQRNPPCEPHGTAQAEGNH